MFLSVCLYVYLTYIYCRCIPFFFLSRYFTNKRKVAVSCKFTTSKLQADDSAFGRDHSCSIKYTLASVTLPAVLFSLAGSSD